MVEMSVGCLHPVDTIPNCRRESGIFIENHEDMDHYTIFIFDPLSYEDMLLSASTAFLIYCEFTMKSQSLSCPGGYPNGSQCRTSGSSSSVAWTNSMSCVRKLMSTWSSEARLPNASSRVRECVEPGVQMRRVALFNACSMYRQRLFPARSVGMHLCIRNCPAQATRLPTVAGKEFPHSC